MAFVSVGAGLLVLAACGQDRVVERRHAGETTATTPQDLIAQAELYTGASLGNKQLILTFDDGPGPLSVTGDLSTWLKNRPVSIKATFFVNGACIAPTTLPNNSCGTPTPGATTVLSQVTSDGHLVANHTTTHRDLLDVVQTGTANVVRELADTDTLIASYIPWNRFLFRAPYGSWTSPTPPANAVFNALSPTAMNKYVGPIYWNIGGGPTDQTASAARAADWECWQLGYTTKQCGDRYLKETRALGNGIVLMHDPYGNTGNHNLTSGTGNTVDMVKYIVPILEGEGFTFKALYEDPEVAAALPTCNANCATCSGPSANQCTSCSGDKYLSGSTCNTCSTCGPGTYRSAACIATADTVCTTCSTCGPGTYRSAACTATSNTVCSTCSACGTGAFTSAACTVTTNTVCAACDASCVSCSGGGPAACTSCGANNYLSAGVCNTCSTCGTGQYQASACTNKTNTVCAGCDASCTACSGPSAAQCNSCPSDFYLNGGTCEACRICAPGTYPSAACSATSNTVCAACHASCTTCSGPAANQCASCPAGFYLSGGTCQACSVCAAGTYQSAACSATSNTVCGACHASCSACSGPDAIQCGACPNGFYLSGGTCHACGVCAAGTYQTTACSTTANIVCAPCAVGTFSSAAGATTCTTCAAGTHASTAGANACTSCGSCDDGNPCTTDACSATVGCTHVAIPGCGSSGSSGTSSSGPSGSSGASSGGTEDGGPSSDSGSSIGGDDGEKGCSASGVRSVSSTSAFSPSLALLAVGFLRRRRARRANL